MKDFMELIVIKKECSNCPDKKCDIGGKCIGLGQTCIDNTKTGDYCTTPCSNVITFCLQCTRDLKCQKCELYYYGEQCLYTCENCPEQQCDIDGICINIEDDCLNSHFTGSSCDNECNHDYEN